VSPYGRASLPSVTGSRSRRAQQPAAVSSSALRVKISEKNGVPQMHAHILLMEALGTTDPDFLDGILCQLFKVGSRGGKADERGLNVMLSVDSARVQEIVGRAADRAEVSLERVLRELKAIAFSNISKAVTWGAERPGPRGGRGRPSRQGYRQRCFAGPERQARREHGRRDRGGVAKLHGRASHQDAQQAAGPCGLGQVPRNVRRAPAEQ
jgi:hypothetical protein